MPGCCDMIRDTELAITSNSRLSVRRSQARSSASPFFSDSSAPAPAEGTGCTRASALSAGRPRSGRLGLAPTARPPPRAVAGAGTGAGAAVGVGIGSTAWTVSDGTAGATGGGVASAWPKPAGMVGGSGSPKPAGMVGGSGTGYAASWPLAAVGPPSVRAVCSAGSARTTGSVCSVGSGALLARPGPTRAA